MTLIIDHKSVPDAANDPNALPLAPPEAATDKQMKNTQRDKKVAVSRSLDTSRITV